jgi:hypothetical protein
MNEVFYLTPRPSTSATQTLFDVEQIYNDAHLYTSLTLPSPSSPGAAPGAETAAVSSSLVGYIDPCVGYQGAGPITGSDNVFYVGANQHVELLTSPASAGSAWSFLDFTGKLQSGVTSVGGVLSGHISGLGMPYQREEVFYIGSVGSVNHVFELWRWSGCPIFGWERYDGWQVVGQFQFFAP